ncbi:MAG TPA: LuxR family transcriptional regulator [Dokdonella sp.]
MRSLLELFERLLSCATQDDLHRAGDACVRRLGYDAWVYAVMPAGAVEMPYICGSSPAAWYTHHFQQGHGVADAVFAHCRTHTKPLLWNVDEPGSEAELSCPVFFRETADFGLRNGITVPVHGLGCRWGMLTVAGSQPMTRRASAQRIGDVALLASYLHEAGHRLACAAVDGEPVHLTQREIECLRWTAEGKTGWEISKVLGISERTVVFHLENAARKFGVFGRRQAAARAIALQLISL